MSDREIIRTIGYITDDKYIASYHGVDVRRVSNLRKQISRRNAEVPKKMYVSRNTATTPVSSEPDNKRFIDARDGSTALLKALHQFFEARLREQGDDRH
jgi:ribosomal protein L10